MPFVNPAYPTYTQEQLTEAFTLIENLGHWKGPVNTVIPKDKQHIVNAAINHFAYGGARFVAILNDPTQVQVIAPGYWAMEASFDTLI